MSITSITPFLEVLEELNKKDCSDKNLLQIEESEIKSIIKLQNLITELIEEYNIKGYVEKTLFKRYKSIVRK